MLQIAGETGLRQEDRCCNVVRGNLSLLDEEDPFILSGSWSSHIVFLRMPRHAIVSRHPCLLVNTAVALEVRGPGPCFVRAALMNLIAALPYLMSCQRQSALAGFVHMLGVLAPGLDEQVSIWRIKEALEFIELNFCNPDLPARDVAVAQRISRRRLDMLLVDSTGYPLPLT
jgi:hypothetical protein